MRRNGQEATVETIDEVKAELDRTMVKKTSPWKSAATLIITMAIFIIFGLRAGFFEASWFGIGLILVVIFIHELGHFAGMKLAGYRHVKMFFIPLLGAAVSGRQTDPRAVRKAVISLSGPLPGILIGIVLAVVFGITRHEMAGVAAQTFLLINLFNLLPFHPLDGGQFLDHVIFSRRPALEIIFKVVTALVLLWVAWQLEAIFLGFFALIVLFSLRLVFLQVRLAGRLKKELPPEELRYAERIPDPVLDRIFPELLPRLGKQVRPISAMATAAQAIWQKACQIPPSWGATIGLILLYLCFLIIGVIVFSLVLVSMNPQGM
jgi:Zn-dependent protease